MIFRLEPNKLTYNVTIQLQQLASSNTVSAAITPLKKTPPHFMEELANLSPAKPYKSTAPPTQGGLTLTSLTSQSSLGFHPLGTPANPLHRGVEDSDESQSNSSSDSESDSGMRAPLETRVPPIEGHVRALELSGSVHEQATSFSQHFQLVGQVQHQHLAPPEDVSVSKSRKKKRKSLSGLSSKKYKDGSNVKISRSQDPVGSRDQLFVVAAGESTSGASRTLLGAGNEGQTTVLSGLLVRIPLVDLRVPDSAQHQLEKPKATVEPIVRNPTTSRTPNRRNTADMTATEEPQNRDRYSRMNSEYITGPVHDYPGGRVDRSRPHVGGRWEREVSRDHRSFALISRVSGRGGEYGRSHGWDRDHYQGSTAGEYWPDSSHYETTRESQRGRGYSRHPSERKKESEYFMQEARRRKKEADKITVHQ